MTQNTKRKRSRPPGSLADWIRADPDPGSENYPKQAANQSLEEQQRKGLRLLFNNLRKPNEQIELLLRTENGQYLYVCNGVEELIEDWYKLDKFKHAYFAINPSDLSKRVRNREVVKFSKGVRSGNDIQRIGAILIDIDPVRKLEGKCGATNDERKAAKVTAGQVWSYLRQNGWPKPFVVSTGNGYQLVFVCDLPVSEKTSIKQFLTFLSAKFDNDAAIVDTVTHSLTQHARLPYTLNRKGVPVANRPHRRASFCKGFPTFDDTVTKQLLDSFIAERKIPLPAEPPASKNQTGRIRGERLRRAILYIDKMEAAVSGSHGHDSLFSVACTLREFDLNNSEAHYALRRYNGRCIPPFSHQELDRKWIESGNTATRIGRFDSGIEKIEEDESLQDFFGFIPDYATGFHKEILKAFGEDGLNLESVIRIYSLVRFKYLKVCIPVEYLRQFYLKPPFGRNWRCQLGKPVECFTFPDNFRSPQYYETCVFCLNGSPAHTHLLWDARRLGQCERLQKIEGKEGLLYANDLMAEGKWQEMKERFRSNSLVKLAFQGPQDSRIAHSLEKFWKDQTFKLVYWPTLLLGRVAGYRNDEIRAIYGLTTELSRFDREPLVIRDATIDVRTDKVGIQCPYLDPSVEYCVFAGNGRFAGKGYRPIGRTSKGWYSRLVSVGEEGRERANKRSSMTKVRYLFSDLSQRLREKFEITPIAYHQGTGQWYGPDALARMSKSEKGYDIISKTTVGFFVSRDWTIRWRAQLAQQLGYESIPGSSSEVTSFRRRGTKSSIDRLTEFMAGKALTQRKLADDLTDHFGQLVSLKRVQRHLSGERDTANFWALIELFMQSKSDL